MEVFQIRLLPQWMGFGQASFNPSILFCSGLCCSEGHVTALVGRLSLMGAAEGWQRSSMPLRLGWEICPWLSERWQLPRSGIPPKVEGSFRSTMGLSSQDGPSLPVRRSVMASQPSCPAAVGVAPFLSLSQGLDEAVLRTISNSPHSC